MVSCANCGEENIVPYCALYKGRPCCSRCWGRLERLCLKKIEQQTLATKPGFLYALFGGGAGGAGAPAAAPAESSGTSTSAFPGTNFSLPAPAQDFFSSTFSVDGETIRVVLFTGTVTAATAGATYHLSRRAISALTNTFGIGRGRGKLQDTGVDSYIGGRQIVVNGAPVNLPGYYGAGGAPTNLMTNASYGSFGMEDLAGGSLNVLPTMADSSPGFMTRAGIALEGAIQSAFPDWAIDTFSEIHEQVWDTIDPGRWLH